MVTRAQVYAALDTERAYQDMRKVRDSGQEFHSIEEFLLYMKVYLDETISISAHTWGPEAGPKTLEHLRKVTALGVACMEQHGAPHRDIPMSLPAANLDSQPNYDRRDRVDARLTGFDRTPNEN